jgi:hypothetical protein
MKKEWMGPGVIPALGRLRQKDPEFKACLSYVVGCKTVLAIHQDPVSKKQ